MAVKIGWGRGFGKRGKREAFRRRSFMVSIPGFHGGIPGFRREKKMGGGIFFFLGEPLNEKQL